jgi:RimJ/RimL family protein N-acetyltransferase
MAIVRPARLSDLELYWKHLRRHGSESGRAGDLIFSPNEAPWDQPYYDFREEKRQKWAKPVDEIGWERTWLITDEAGVYGDLSLVHLPPIQSTLHRATLMMGMERSHRGQGYGTQLITAALAFAQLQPTLAWLQLFVFAHNEPALGLYRKFGFQESGTVPDMFRVFGKEIADTVMVLRI